MQAAISTDLLTQLFRASPEQVAAIELILGCGVRNSECGVLEKGAEPTEATENGPMAALLRIEQKVDGLIASGQLPEKKKPLGEAERLQVFRLFGELLAMGTELTAPPARVFDLMVFKKLTKAEAAVACKCAASLITRRVATIEGHFGMPIEDLRTYASDIKERQSTVKGDRYAKKKHGAVRDERERCDDSDQPSLKEDGDGYLPEEKPDYG